MYISVESADHFVWLCIAFCMVVYDGGRFYARKPNLGTTLAVVASSRAGERSFTLLCHQSSRLATLTTASG
jgi:hypothetical protein